MGQDACTVMGGCRCRWCRHTRRQVGPIWDIRSYVALEFPHIVGADTDRPDPRGVMRTRVMFELAYGDEEASGK